MKKPAWYVMMAVLFGVSTGVFAAGSAGDELLQASGGDSLPPVLVVRQTYGDNVRFATSAAAATHLSSDTSSSRSHTALSERPMFYLFTTAYRGTIPVAQFRDLRGQLHFATDQNEIARRRRDGLEEADDRLFIYAQQVEGASELFCLRDPATDAEVYTVDPAEKALYLRAGWTALPSLGWTQAVDSSGVGILKESTLVLEAPEVAALSAVNESGRELVFDRTTEVLSVLKSGSVIYAEKSTALPSGLVHRVDSVLPTGTGGILLQVTPVPLGEAFEEVHLYIPTTELRFPSDGGRAGSMRTEAAGPLAAAGTYDNTVTKDYIAEWETTSKGLRAKLTLTGRTAVGITIEGRYDETNACTTMPPSATFVLTPHQQFTMKVEVSGSLGAEKEKPIFKPIPVTVPLGGIPVSGEFTVYAGYEAGGTLTGSLTATETSQGTGVLRVDKAKRSLDAQICPSSCPNGFLCGSGPKPAANPCGVNGSASVDGTFDVKASFYLKPELFLYVGAASVGTGPYIDAKTQLQFRSEKYATGLYLQFIPEVGVKAKIGCWEAKASQTYNPPNGKEFVLLKTPIPPAGVVASDGTYRGRVLVSWNGVPGVTGYEIFRATSLTGTKTKLQSVPGTTESYNDAVSTTTKYYYFVRAVINNNPGPYGAPDTGYATK